MGSGISSSSSALSFPLSKLYGDNAFKSGDILEAILWWSQALSELHTNQIKERAILYSNRSLAYIQTNQNEKALEDALMCIQINPMWSKGYYRASKVCKSSSCLFLKAIII
jgi:tetratricopeptide (TPR) repeat protein